MITIINATNLLGDSIYTLQPINQFRDEMGASEENLILVADRGLAFQMFQDTFLGPVKLFDNIDHAIQSCKQGEDITQIRLDAGTSGHICFTSAQQTGRQMHISEGYAQMLGIKLKGPIIPYAPWANWEANSVPRDSQSVRSPIRIGISPFSKSCARHSGERPNKTLDDWKWMHIIHYLRLHCDELCVIGGPKDVLTNCPISEDEKWCASSFADLRQKLKSLTVFITVDNGLGHLASVLNVQTLLLWPQVSSPEFIAPLWAPNTKYIMGIDPPTVTPAVLLTGMRIFVQQFIDAAR